VEEIANTLSMLVLILVMIVICLTILGFLVAGVVFLFKEWWYWMKGIWRS
jgi:uncharacterized membrane protein